ncbi:MAG TPA: SgcJ/EcaC family oxidoreductase [Gaiellaceae bacterium]|nr:SgcJ/EcaC family oxidoreductase [Gaiellaceae bacterium]
MEQMLKAYAVAVRAKDADAFMDLYADDVRNFDLWNDWSYDGKAELSGMVTEWFGSLDDDEEVVVEWDDVRAQAGEDVAALSAFLTFSAVSPEGKKLRSMNNRLTWVLRKDGDGEWKIAHEHTSAPAGEEGKVQLRR